MKNFENIFASDIVYSCPIEMFSLEQLRKEMSWEAIAQKVPRLPRGWYELMGLSKKDRIDLCLDFWCSILGLEHSASPGICRFFSLLETLEVYIFRFERGKGPYDVKMFYSFCDGRCGFQGAPPLAQSEGRWFPPLGDSLYERFFTIHNGFGKWEDEGIFPYRSLARVQQQLRQQLVELNKVRSEENCYSLGLFPFYGYEEPFTYQCFLFDPEIRRDLSSPNLFLGEESLKHRSLENIELLHLTASHYPSFLSWLENYLHSEEVYNE
ncbi:hypothetical protein [Candidatus Chlamydia sanziniae]|uniref:SMI1/KNR4 family protein n=1 Tax=Candidatus Chlamydia sanziniae TaxID=1806891 RepID=A0A1A9HVR1_9CHLA|nr:hypothetical protein [Candidatus Chlamydia sanziniae]ANH78193.1 hypothetical protein Cs308_0017 [Candidatus Chlamydia sanziniae]